MDYQARVKKLQRLIAHECEAFYIENPIQLLYLTSFSLSKGLLLVTPNKAELIVDGRYIEACSKHSPFPTYNLMEMPLTKWLEKERVKTLGFDAETLSYKNYQLLLECPNITLAPLKGPVQRLRLIKDADEIERLKQAAKLTVKGFDYAFSLLKEGLSEEALSLKLEFFWRKNGAKGLAFEPMIAFGTHCSMPHHRASSNILHHDEEVLIDAGLIWQNYHSDMTRVHFFGKPSPQITKIYEIVEKAKERALALCCPGSTVGEIDLAARTFIADQGYGDYFPHSLGHGIGLEIHEPPILRFNGPYKDLKIETGMVITIEPGIYLPGIGGVRLEDTLLITENGYNILTQ